MDRQSLIRETVQSSNRKTLVLLAERTTEPVTTGGKLFIYSKFFYFTSILVSRQTFSSRASIHSESCHQDLQEQDETNDCKLNWSFSVIYFNISL